MAPGVGGATHGNALLSLPEQALGDLGKPESVDYFEVIVRARRDHGKANGRSVMIGEGENDDAERDAVPTERIESVGLDVTEEPLDRNEGGDGGDGRAEGNHAPVRWFGNFGVTDGGENFVSACSQKGRDSEEE